MTSRSARSPRRPVTVALCLMLALTAIACIAASDAKAAYYKMVACSGNNGAPAHSIGTNTTSPQNPGGIFHIWNWCDGQGGDPPGEGAFFRIQENQNSGNAGYGAYGHFVFDTPSHVHFKTAGGYTRQPHQFNNGWRSRFWVASCCSTAQTFTQGAGLGLTTNFAPHLWPIGALWDFTRFVFEMQCVNGGGCDRSGTNATDLNGLVFTLSDDSNSQVAFTNTGAPLLAGKWVRGAHNVTFNVSDLGSGIRHERMRIDGAQRWNWDHGGECNTSWSGSNGEWARDYRVCPTGGPWGRSVPLDTATLSDGRHTVQLCTQDYGQYQGLHGTGGETCTQREIQTDNTAPGAPAGLQVVSANPERYLDRFGARFSLPPNQGSPIAKVHYEVRNGVGEVVKSKKTLSATNPTAISGIEGPEHPGPYTLRVWLEDQVGHVGPAASAPVPRDTKPPAAPQALRIVGSAERWVERFDLRWRNVVDSGSPIVRARYRVLDGSGKVAVAVKALTGENLEALKDVQSPRHRGEYTAEVWLEDAEGNVGVPAAVPLPRDTTPPAAPQLVSLAAPGSSRATEGFDLRWTNIVDAGSPIDAAHYRVRDGAGRVVVPVETVEGKNVQAIERIETATDRGAFSLDLWLRDAEGNVGAPVSVPLAHRCVRSPAAGGSVLTSGLGANGGNEEVVKQGTGSTLRGRLSGTGGGVAAAPLCVFSRIVTRQAGEFVGLAMSGPDGRFRFPIPAGASRELTVMYRSGAREVTSRATIQTKVRPFFKVRRKVVYNKTFARFTGCIPGPDNDRVVIVLQVRRGKGWLAFRRYRTRGDCRFTVGYRFNRTTVPTKYVMRAQVRTQAGYPYLQGNSKHLKLIVRPPRNKRHRGSASALPKDARPPDNPSQQDSSLQRGREPGAPWKQTGRFEQTAPAPPKPSPEKGGDSDTRPSRPSGKAPCVGFCG